MKELADILVAMQPVRLSGEDAALATVVRVQGSAYRRPGARMLITGSGHTVGGVSGGCLERDVVQRAGAIMRSSQPVLVRYDTTVDSETGSGYSLGCGGTIDILIEPLNTPAGLRLMEWLQASQTGPQVIATVVSKRHPAIRLGERLRVDPSAAMAGQIGSDAFSKTIAEDALKAMATGRSNFFNYPTSAGTVEIFMEVLEPPLDLLIFGAGSDALPLVDFAKSLGWRVTLVDVRSAALDPNRVWAADEVIRCDIGQVSTRVTLSNTAGGAGAAAVVMTHNFSHDLQLIRWLSTQPVRYLGLLGPRHRTELVLTGLPGVTLHSPVGLDIGADNPQEVALAIVAEITAVLRGRTGLPLCSVDGPIHVGNPQKKVTACTAAVL